VAFIYWMNSIQKSQFIQDLIVINLQLSIFLFMVQVPLCQDSLCSIQHNLEDYQLFFINFAKAILRFKSICFDLIPSFNLNFTLILWFKFLIVEHETFITSLK
jgi:hypothetical protein